MPERLSVPPSEEGKFTIVGIPTGDKILLTISDGTVTEQAEIVVERLSKNDLVKPLPQGIALRFVAKFEAEQLPHVDGEAEKDEMAILQSDDSINTVFACHFHPDATCVEQ